MGEIDDLLFVVEKHCNSFRYVGLVPFLASGNARAGREGQRCLNCLFSRVGSAWFLCLVCYWPVGAHVVVQQEVDDVLGVLQVKSGTIFNVALAFILDKCIKSTGRGCWNGKQFAL